GLEANGATNETFSEGLGDFSLNALSAHPAFASDASGNIAIAEIGVDKGLVLIDGAADKLSDQGLATTEPVDAMTFAGSSIVIAAAGAMPSTSKPNAFLAGQTTTNCALAEAGGSAMAAAALASDGTTVYAYTRDGNIVGYALTALMTGCTSSDTPAPVTSTTPTIATGTAAPNGGYLALIGSPATLAIAVAFDSASTTAGAVTVV